MYNLECNDTFIFENYNFLVFNQCFKNTFWYYFLLLLINRFSKLSRCYYSELMRNKVSVSHTGLAGVCRSCEGGQGDRSLSDTVDSRPSG